MILKHYRFTDKTEYVFKTDKLFYAIKGSDGSYSFSINYEIVISPNRKNQGLLRWMEIS
jgi:hypothetical protein